MMNYVLNATSAHENNRKEEGREGEGKEEGKEREGKGIKGKRG